VTQRPVFLPTFREGPVVDEVFVGFRWNPGFSATQKRKNVVALHQAASQMGLAPLLEVSTKSEEPLGRALSAFNFEVGVAPGRKAPIEVAYQGSKVFEEAGPFTDLFDASPRDAKRDPRLRESGRLIAFEFGGITFPLDPPTAFYDWLFLRALSRDSVVMEGLCAFSGFTDIEFNPEKSINCQARSCATAVTLVQRNELVTCAKSFARFVEVLAARKSEVTHSGEQQQFGI
jgi:hypothetical protein